MPSPAPSQESYPAHLSLAELVSHAQKLVADNNEVGSRLRDMRARLLGQYEPEPAVEFETNKPEGSILQLQAELYALETGLNRIIGHLKMLEEI